MDTYLIDTSKTQSDRPYGERVLTELKRRGKDMAWLAKRIKVSSSTITRIVKGETEPSAYVMRGIRSAIGVSYSEDTDVSRPGKLQLFEAVASLDDSEAEKLLALTKTLFPEKFGAPPSSSSSEEALEDESEGGEGMGQG